MEGPMMTRTRLRPSVSFLIAMLDLPFKVADVIADATSEE
jgi:hypothetical protein